MYLAVNFNLQLMSCDEYKCTIKKIDKYTDTELILKPSGDSVDKVATFLSLEDNV